MADNRSIYTEDGWVRAEGVSGHGAMEAAEALRSDLAARLKCEVRIVRFQDRTGKPTNAYEVQAKADPRRIEDAVHAKGRPFGRTEEENASISSRASIANRLDRLELGKSFP